MICNSRSHFAIFVSFNILLIVFFSLDEFGEKLFFWFFSTLEISYNIYSTKKC